MKTILSILVSCLSINLSSAQWMAGIKGGIGLNSVSIIQVKNISTMAQENLVGADFGIVVDRNLLDYLSLRAELIYTQKGYSLRKYASDTLFEAKNTNNSDKYSLRNNYLQIPILIRYYEGFKRLKFFLQTGPYLGYWMSGQFSGDKVDYYLGNYSVRVNQSTSEPYIFNNQKKDNRLDFGGVIGGGLQYLIKREGKEFMQLYLEARYSRGFLDLQKNNTRSDYAGQFNSNLTFSLGLLYIIPSEKNY
jgi:hypothetical protein